VNVVLVTSARDLTEVVVTALGASKEKKTLGYAQTTVKSDVLTKSAPIDLLGGIQGKVAGVRISEVSGTPGGSTKVVLRGYSSFTGTNQPLYVVDGVPFDNSRLGSDNNFDFGNNADDIDPNIVDNISILKGAAATALYGERGSNGVILITTKKGKSGKPVVDVSTGVTLTDMAFAFKPQSEFGQGWGGTFILSENGDWGPKYDGVVRPWGATGSGTGATIGDVQLLKPYVFLPNNIQDAFDTGVQANNSVQVSGGTDASQYLMSFGNVYANGILPGSPDVYKRNNFTLRGATQYKNFSADASLTYVNSVHNDPASGQGNSDGSTFYESLLQIPSDIPIKDLRDYKNTFFNVDNYFTPYAENPYYDLYENGSRMTQNRIYGNINLSYKITNWFTLNFQQGVDVSSQYGKIWNNKNAPSPGSWNAGNNVEGSSRAADLGSDEEDTYNNFEYDSKLQGLFVKKFNKDFDINAVLGVNYNDRGEREVTTKVEDLTFPGFYQINNSSNKPTSTGVETHRRLLGFYGQATFGYKDDLFLTLTGRNDNTSTLAPGKNSYFYPGASLAWVLTQALDLKSTILSYAKLRASYGETGTDTDPYNLYNTLTAANVPLGFGNITFPISGVSGYTISNTLLNTSLQPAKVSEFELGGEFRFLNDRLGLDATYYQRINKNQILSAPIAPSTGYTAEEVNFGKVRNRGVEITLNGTPIKSSLVTWNVSYNFSADRSLVQELAPGVSTLLLNSAYDAQMLAVVGKPLGEIYAPVAALDPQGHTIVNSSGIPIASSTLGDYGHVAPDFTMGLVNNIRVDKFTLGFTFDYSQGGVFYSGTADLLNFIGADPKTTYNDRNPFIVPNSVQASTDASTGKTTYSPNSQEVTTANIVNMYYPTTNLGTSYKQRILTKTYIKLREVTLNYDLPKSIANKIDASKASIGLVGRNLWTWLPSSNQTIDPEVSNLGSDLASEFGEFRAAPPLRYYGATLKVSF
jgi:TonB-linked SusC/RagA family outer membrane protein